MSRHLVALSWLVAAFAAHAVDDVPALLKAADRFRADPGKLEVQTEVTLRGRDGAVEKERSYTVWLQGDRRSLVLMRSPAEAGQKVLGWGVSYAFRPNDVVQQEVRRSLSGTSPAGRPLLQAEYFDADSAYSLVWANPSTWGRSAQQVPAAQESALAARAYWRRGALDLHGFARLGERAAASLGAAAAWVPGEATEWHASLRWLQRHETWALAADPLAGPSPGNPWQPQRPGGTAQALAGMNRTGEQQQGVLLEAWHDGNAPSDATWRAWGTHSAALRASAAPVAARAGNLAWQTTPLNGPGLRQDNLFAHLSWQPGAWQWWGDVLVHPADGGRSLSVGMQWQGDRWRLQASHRTYGGRQDSVLAQLPTRRGGRPELRPGRRMRRFRRVRARPWPRPDGHGAGRRKRARRRPAAGARPRPGLPKTPRASASTVARRSAMP